MKQEWTTICDQTLARLSNLENQSQSVVVLNTFFDPEERFLPLSPQTQELTAFTIEVLEEINRVLKFGGLFFIFGLPSQLPIFGQYLETNEIQDSKTVFKYWISLDLDNSRRNQTLTPTHHGLLMFLKSKARSLTPSPFQLNTSSVRAPHAFCAACGLNVKDWGGKKHLMNPLGISLSDVWRDLPKTSLKNHLIPECVLERIRALTEYPGANFLKIVQNTPGIQINSTSKSSAINLLEGEKDTNLNSLKFLEQNKVYQGDSIIFLKKVSELYPNGIFDLTFADPPYNLKKEYSTYDDALADQRYIEWCNQWLEGMIRTLKPGGSLFVLNLPRWSLHHSAYLNKHMEFRHWIAWDALSDPRGKLMPAHYTLLYYTKPGAKPVFNYSALEGNPMEDSVFPPDAPIYCLRASCIKHRKRIGDDKKVELSDIWFDIHRIKHKRDRDAHPCQLPEKLLNRIILLTTKKGGLVFDPFCGTGTTALAARKLDRNFVTIDLDPNYVAIASQKLESLHQQADLFGLIRTPRQVVKRDRPKGSKKEVEIYLQELAKKLGKEPSEQEIAADNPYILEKIDLLYPTRLSAIKRCRVAL